jgi:hypothetical protein
MIRQPYIIDAFASDLKDSDGNILSMGCYIDEDFGTEYLVNMDDGMREILDKEELDSSAIFEANQYDLIICMDV